MKFYDKKIYELNNSIEEIVILLVALIIGYVVGYIAGGIYNNSKLDGNIEQYKFNEYVIEQNENNSGV